MRLAIINPNLSGSISGLDMGVAYLATYIDERTKHQVKIIDLTFHRKDWKGHIRKEFRKFKPEVVGISVVSLYLSYARDVAREVKRISRVPIIVGGMHPTLEPEETIKIPEFDALSIADGEETLTEYLDALQENKPLSTIKGLWYKQKGQVHRNEGRPWTDNINSLPIPNYDLWDDIDKYFKFMQRLYFIGVRGCPYRCTYCDEHALNKTSTGKRYRIRDPRAFAREVKHQYDKYRERGMRLAHMFDAVFTFDKKWLEEFTDEYKKLGLSKRLPYTIFIKADNLNSSEDKLKMLKDSGCRQIRVGIEAGDEDVRTKIYKKAGTTNKQLEGFIKAYKKHGLVVKAYNILGGPGETQDTIKKTVEINKRFKTDIPLFFTYTPLPGTTILEMIEGETTMATSLHFKESIHLKGVPKNFVEKMQRHAYLYFVPRMMIRVFLKHPIKFSYMMATRVLSGIALDADLRLVVAYTVSSPLFWDAFAQA
ncbi:MAG: radical SAM protein [Candidatus Woesearchaeota archaeon]